MLVVLTTFPDAESGREIASRLLDERLAACVSLLGPCESHYVWNGERQTATEVPALIKTTEEGYARLEARLRALHPYEVPEIIAIPAERCLEAYEQWVRRGCEG